MTEQERSEHADTCCIDLGASRVGFRLLVGYLRTRSDVPGFYSRCYA